MLAARLTLAGFSIVLLAAAPGFAQTTTRVTLGNATNFHSNRSDLSADGRYVVFESKLTNLVPGDTNDCIDVFRHDLQTGTTIRVSLGAGGTEGNGNSSGVTISADGRYVAFSSLASNLVVGDADGQSDAFVHDILTGTTVACSVDGTGTLVGGGAGNISADGQHVVFTSSAIVAPPTCGSPPHVFVRHLITGTSEAVDVNATGGCPSGMSNDTFISGDGRYVVYWTTATNMVTGVTDTNGSFDIIRRDLQTGTNAFVSFGASGNADANDDCFNPSISDDGRYVVFETEASNIVPGDAAGTWDIFVRDMVANTTTRANLLPNGGVAAGGDAQSGSITADGRYVVFHTNANLDPDDGGDDDVYIRDRQRSMTHWVSLNSGGARGDSGAYGPAISDDGSTVSFESRATTFAPGETDYLELDVFVRERADGTWSFVRECFPGENAIQACPCGNPPSGQGHGCENHGTGPVESGRLRGSGNASLSSDSLVFTADGLNNTSFAVFWQGVNPAGPAGAVHGAGIRCVSGLLRRLYNGNAVAASISKPGMGDQNVHLRAAATGDNIAVGNTRRYFAIYRDPGAATPCGDTATTINLTNSGRVVWGP